jgi:GH25 family lysozyme M1 (1,4-beta-N-acetylmuramidase)
MINFNFLEQNKQALIDIYKKERYIENNNVEGSLIIDYRKNNNVDVYYWTVNNMTDEVKQLFIEEFKKNVDKKNIVYLVLIDNEQTLIQTYQL